ncbi:type I-E CRISPR-associated protein Cse2/CasB [Thauera aromatica]|nr:type I-E CRISPR-associated protein Cse2/CasB [Thauera aromatica]MCK2126364.1 type I-E CRISPR-associated protein Cse2/CasB [Thauera aromatica]
MEPMQVEEQQPEKAPPSREERFVAGVLKLCAENKGMAARLRRADNPATEYQSWELLAAYGIDLEQERERLPFVTVAAAIAKAKVERNGSLGLGRAIAASYENGSASDQAKARLRRLLACDDLAELCRILRPLLSLIDSKVAQPLDYIRLLKQLRRFPFNAQQVRVQWAQEFYGQSADAGEEGA